MPTPLSSTTDAAREHAHVVEVSNMRKRENRSMRDVTKRVTESPAIPGDRTQNGAERRKSRKLTDNLAQHMSDTAHVTSDMRIMQDDTLREIRRSSSPLLVRNPDGTINERDTLALIARVRLYRAGTKGR